MRLIMISYIKNDFVIKMILNRINPMCSFIYGEIQNFLYISMLSPHFQQGIKNLSSNSYLRSFSGHLRRSLPPLPFIIASFSSQGLHHCWLFLFLPSLITFYLGGGRGEFIEMKSRKKTCIKHAVNKYWK